MQAFLNRKRTEPISLEELQELLPDFTTILYDELENRPIRDIIGSKSGAILYYEHFEISLSKQRFFENAMIWSSKNVLFFDLKTQ